MEVADRKKLVERIGELSESLSPLPSRHAVHLNPLEDIRCVAFDFYGTMFLSGVGDIGIDEEQKEESERLFLQSLKASGLDLLDGAAGKEGIKILKRTLDHTIAEAEKRGIPYPEPEIRDVWEHTLVQLKQDALISGTIDAQTVNRFAIEFEFRINTIWPVPGLASVLQQLLERDLKLGIISNSQFYTPLAFEAFLGKTPEAFGFEPELLLWSFEAGRKKPDVEFYRIFVDRLPAKRLEASQVLYVGNDIRKDIEPAKALGMRTALFVGDSRSIRHDEEELADPAYKPDLVIDDLAQIPECLNLQP